MNVHSDLAAQVADVAIGYCAGAPDFPVTSLRPLAIRVTDLARFVDVFVGEADVGAGRNFCFGSSVASARLQFSRLLGGIVLVGQTAFRGGLDSQRVDLRKVGGPGVTNPSSE